MKRKNAFTLIELLAVIVILAVIALIAVPLVMNTIEDAKKASLERSYDNIEHSAETYVYAKLEELNIPNYQEYYLPVKDLSLWYIFLDINVCTANYRDQ